MKLLVCATEYYPHGSGIANVAYNVVQELEKKGVECTICSPTGPDIKLGNRELIKRTGIIGMLHFWHQVSRHFKNVEYDAVWLHNPYFLTPPSFMRCLVTMHSTYLGSSSNRLGNLPYRLYKSVVAGLERYSLTQLPHSTNFIGVSKQVCLEIEKNGISDSKIAHVPNGVDTSHFHSSCKKKELRAQFGIPEDHIVLLSVGRLTPAKQHSTLIEIFSRLDGRCKDLTLCIAGKGELFDEIRTLAEKRGLKNIIFLGHVDYHKCLPDLYACSDYYIMTSKYEGFPLTLLEAMASGLPCIVSDIPNLNIVRDADCGIIVDFDNLSAASEKIYNYLKIDNHSHGVNARSYVVNSLDWGVISRLYLRAIEEVSAN